MDEPLDVGAYGVDAIECGANKPAGRDPGSRECLSAERYAVGGADRVRLVGSDVAA